MPLILSNFKEVKELKNEMVSFYSKLHCDMLDDEKFHNLEVAHLLNLPQKFANQGVVLPTAREIVETAVDHISPTARRIDVPRRSGTKAAAEQAKLLRRFYASLLTFLEAGPPVSPYREITKHLQLPSIGKWNKVKGVLLPGGKHISDHMINNGILGYTDFEEHVRQAEKELWEDRFPVYAQWR